MPQPDVVLVPSEVVEFASSGPSRLALHNIGVQPVAFKVAFTSPNLLMVVPSEGMVPPGKHVEAVLTPVSTSEAANLPHRVIVRTVAVAPGAKKGPELWTAAAPADIHEHLLSCSRARPAAAEAGAPASASGPSAAAVAIGGQRSLSLPRLGSRGTDVKARLAACERLLLLRSSQLAAAEHQLVTAEHTRAAAAATSSSTAAPTSGDASRSREPPEPWATGGTKAAATRAQRAPSPPPARRCAPGLASHLCVGALALALGLAWRPLLVAHGGAEVGFCWLTCAPDAASGRKGGAGGRTRGGGGGGGGNGASGSGGPFRLPWNRPQEANGL